MFDSNCSNDIDDQILGNYGGVIDNSLIHTIDMVQEQDTPESIIYSKLIKHSGYYDDKLMSTLIDNDRENFTILSTNIESVYAKFDELELFISEQGSKGIEFHAICLQECWVSNPDISTLQIKGYNCIVKKQTASKKGGLIIYLQEDYDYEIIDNKYDKEIWECQMIKVHGNNLNKNIILGNIYRPPKETTNFHEIFKDDLSKILHIFEKEKAEILLAGDYNLNLLNYAKNTVNEFFEMMLTNSFFPKITLPTRFSNTRGTLIDNVFHKFNSISFESNAGILLKQFSDHLPIFVQIKAVKDKTKQFVPKYVTVHETSKKSHDDFLNELNRIDIKSKLNSLPNADTNLKYNTLAEIIENAKQKYLPAKVKKFNKYKHKRQPFITEGILISIKFKDKLHKKLRNLNPDSSEYLRTKSNFQTYNAMLKKTLRTAKTNFYHRCFENYRNDIRKTWSTINDLLNRNKKKKSFPEFFIDNGEMIKDKLQIAQGFNNFFINIGPKLASKIKNQSNSNAYAYLIQKKSSSFNFKHINEMDISKIIDKMPHKNSFGHDGISSKLIKLMKPIISGPLELIINDMLDTGIFPDQLKIAKVIPIYKKNDKNLFNNYRPISILPVISKIFEKVIYQQIYEHMEKLKLLFEFQYGFRRGHSTEHAALHLIDKVICDMDKGEIPIGIFLDLSKAFDTLNHDILLKKLNHYGINGISAQLINSYLSGRQQYVEYEGIKSTKLAITTGVPQGSILGPLLFIIYINDIANISKLFEKIVYADDTSLLTNLNHLKHAYPNKSYSEIINIELKNIHTWLMDNKLSLNIDKTKYMIFHHREKNIPDLEIKIENLEIKRVECFNFLGLNIDQHVTWQNQLKNISTKISRSIGILNKLKHLLPTKTKLIIYNSFINSHINYCILAWGFKLSKITTLQKKAIRIVAGSKYNSHTDPIFIALRCLKANDIFRLAKIKFYYQFMHGTLPSYFLKLPLVSNSTVHCYNTRVCKNLHTLKSKTSFGKLCIRYDIPITINNLDDQIRNRLETHSQNHVCKIYKEATLTKYNNTCTIQNCYICNH